MANQGYIGKVSWVLFGVAIDLLLITIRPSDARCNFPEFLTSNSSGRDWKGRIRDQNAEVTLQITINDNIMRVISTDNSATSYNRLCIRSVDGDKYLVAHEGQNQNGSQFTCMQFIPRSENVIQIKQSQVGRSMNSKICNDNRLNLDPWLIIDSAHVANDVRPIPLQGGFSMHIYDKRHRVGVCDAYQGQTRMESECAEGEGLVFHFRYARCVPEALYMYKDQRTLCLAHWQEGSYTFALLRHDEYSQYMWLLRYSTSMGNSDSMVLFEDLVADMVAQVTETVRYLRLDSVRDTPRPAHALCVDEYEACTTRRDPCDDPVMAMVCPRTCGICHQTRPQVCTFSNSVIGQWYNAAEPASLALTVNSTSLITFSDNIQEQLHCIQWDEESKDKPHENTHMVVREFYNGCRPRYSCVQFVQQSSSALFFKLSQSRSWPFTSSPDDIIDCRKFSYEDEEESITPNKFRTKTLNLVYIRASNTVPCELPRTEGNYIATLLGGVQCTSNIAQDQSANSFSIDFLNCSEQETTVDFSGEHTCADSSRVFPRRDHVLVTRSRNNQDAIYCWIIPHDIHDVFYLVSASDCNEATRKRLNRGRLKPLLVLTRTGILPDLDPDYDRNNPAETLPKVVTTPPLNRPAPSLPGRIDATGGYDRKETDSIFSEEIEIGLSTDLYDYDQRGNSTYEYDSNMRITATSVVVITVVVLVAVVQAVCVCK